MNYFTREEIVNRIEDISLDDFINLVKIANHVEHILAACQMDQMLIAHGLDYESNGSLPNGVG